MQNLINKILKILKDHVRQNNLEIKLNQEEIGKILSESDKVARINDELEYKRSLNRELLHENDDFITMQLQITEFMEKYGHLISDDEAEADLHDELENEDSNLPYFNQTIEGNIAFGPGHPQFYNNRFFTELLKYYQEKEDYEMCDQLVKLKRENFKF